MFLRAGAGGGILTPSLATGAAMGSVVALSVNSWTQLEVGVPAASLTCAAGVLTITQRAPAWAAMSSGNSPAHRGGCSSCSW